MIRKNTKKKVSRKRNPVNKDRNRLRNVMSRNFLNHYNNRGWFLNHVFTADPDAFSKYITYIKQGYECEDCEKEYDKCECEYCPDCKFNRCLCMLDIERKTNYPAEERIRVAKVWWELSKLFDEPYENLPYYPEKDSKFIRFTDFLSQNSSFPEYREIALNLLEAYDDKVDISNVGKNLIYYDLSDMDLSGMDLSAHVFYKTIMKNTNLQRANLSHTNLSEMRLEHVNMSNTDLSSSRWYKVILSKSNLSNSNLSNSKLDYVESYNSDLSSVNLRDSDFYMIDLIESNLSKADLTGASSNSGNSNFYKTNLSGANLTNADLSNVSLEGTNFTDAIIDKSTIFRNNDFIEKAIGLRISNPIKRRFIRKKSNAKKSF